MRSFPSPFRRHPQAASAVRTALTAYFAAFALCNIGGFPSTGILSLLLFFVLYAFFSEAGRRIGAAPRPPHFLAATGLLAALYTLFYLAAEHKKLTGGFDNRLFRFSFVLFTAIGLFVLFAVCVRLAMLFFARIRPQARRPFSRRVWLLTFAGLLLCWLPWFLYDYPGVMTPDSISQFSQITGQIPYSSHHSLIHTLFIGLCYRAGFFFTHSVNGGIAFYTVIQMLLVAGTDACCLSLLRSRGIPGWMRVCFFLFWGLIPYNAIFAVTMWKDVLFSACMLLYALLLFCLLEAPPLRARRWLYAGLFCTGWLVCMLRSNGLYAFLFALPFTLYCFRKRGRAMAPVQLAVVILAILVKGPVFDAFGVARPHFTESLSIPLQQVARVVCEGRELTAEQEALLNRVAEVSLIPEYYDPIISDPIKALVVYNNADYLESHRAEFFRLWAELGLIYPRDYAEAFIDQTKGYWFPARADLSTNEGISPNDIGLLWPHVLRGMLPVRISEILLKLPELLPVYGILWSIGAFSWMLLFLAAFQFLYGNRDFLLLYVPFAGVILTLLLATPVASDLRYAYPLFLGMPLLLSVRLCSPGPRSANFPPPVPQKIL